MKIRHVMGHVLRFSFILKYLFMFNAFLKKSTCPVKKSTSK